MKVLALVPSLYGVSPGQRSSVELWEPVLAAHGISITYAPFETTELARILYRRGNHAEKTRQVFRALARRVSVLRSLDNFDAVLVYREAALLGPPIIERWVARRGKPIIY